MRFLVAAILLLSAQAQAARAPRPPAKKRPPAVEMLALNTHEVFTLQPDVAGRFTKKELRGWNHFLRCHHTGRVHAMAMRLAPLIYETAKHFSWGKILVVAGYRAPRIAREKGNPKSPHKKGLACDFRVDGVANTELRDYLRGAFPRIGVGYYPNSDFIHLDVRPKVSAFWIDYSAPGERARYSKAPDEDLRAEKFDDDDTPGATAQAPENPPENPQNSEGSQPQMGLGPGLAAPNSPTLAPLMP